jgi:hypothetical protein
MRSPLPPTPPQPPRIPPPAGPHARWRSLARMLRARHARHARRQPIDAVLRRPVELFQPQAARVSSHLALNCFVTLKVTPRAAVQAMTTRVERRKAGSVMAGGVMRDRVRLVERHVASVERGGGARVASPASSLYSRRRIEADRGVSTSAVAARRAAGGSPFGGFDGRDGSARSALSDSIDMRSDGRVFAAPRGLLQTEEAARTFGHMIRRLGRQESRVTPVASVAVARRATEAPRGEPRTPAMSETTFTAQSAGMGMTTAMRMQAGADVNIEALASKVMQQIDRRVVAHRERMGRI